MRSLMLFSVLMMVVFSGAADEGWALNLEEYHSPFGVVDHTLYPTSRQLGAIWIRHPDNVFWLEPAPGSFQWAWDGKLDDMEGLGLNYASVLAIGKCWMSGFGGDPEDFPSYPPYDLTAVWDDSTGYSPLYYDFIYTLVDRYRGRVDHLTIENEGNAEHFWAGTADEYVRVLKTAHKAAHDADPGFMIFDSGIASGAWGACIARDRYESGQYSDQEILDFVNEYYDRNVYFPVYFSTIEDLLDWIYGSFVQGQYQRIIYMLANMGDALDGMNFKFTEYYWLLDDVLDWIDMRTGQAGYHVDFKCNNEASNWPGVSEAQHAKELLQKYVVGLSLGVERTLWFPLSWEIAPTPRMALLDSNGVWMETAYAFQHGARTIGHEFAFDYMDTSDPDVFNFVFRHRSNAEHHLRVCWYDDGTHSPGSSLVRFYLPPVTKQVIVSDYRGYRSVASVMGEEYIDITVTESPITVEYFQDRSQITGLEPGGDISRPRVEQNYPNPFNPATTIAYQVPGRGGEVQEVDLAIYDSSGRMLRRLVSGPVPPGRHTVRWGGETDRGQPAGPGVYFYRFRCGDVAESHKMILAP